jgi:hypothetical protein
VDLSNPNNDFGTLAANVEGTISISDLNDLVIGIGPAITGIITTDSDVRITTVGTLTLDAPIQVGIGDLRLDSSSAVTQSAAISGAGLQLTGAGPFTLTNSDNAFTTLAADTAETIEYTNAGALTVGTVQVLGHELSGITASSGEISVSAEESLDVVRSITNSGGGDTRLFSGLNLTVSASIESSLDGGPGGGSIDLVAAGDVLVNDDVTTTGGTFRGDDATTGLILIDAGGRINLEEGVIVSTGTGQMTGFATVNEAGESVRTPPPVEVVVFPVDQGGSNVNSLGVGYIDVTVNDPGVVNYQIEVDWGDRTILTYRPEDAFSGGDDFVSENTYRLRYTYQPDNIPDPNNPAAPIPVKVTIRYDGREVADTDGGYVRGIAFREGEGRVDLSTTVETELTVPGTGLFGFIKVTESVIVPVELRPTAPVLYGTSEVAPAVRQEELFALQAAAADQASIAAMRIFFRRVDAAGKEGPDVELPADAFDRGLDSLFRKFPNGHYRVYLQEANSQRIRLIREIHVYQGRIVPADFRDDVMERQPGSASDERPQDPASEPPVDSADDPADDQPADPAGGEQNGTGAAGAAVLAVWSAGRRTDRLDRALEQAGKTGAKFGRRRRRAGSDKQT